MDKLLREVPAVDDESHLSTAEAPYRAMGSQEVQALQDKYQSGVRMVGTSEGAISDPVLPMEARILLT